MKLTANTNVAKFYAATTNQLAITKFLCKSANLSKNAPVYFDDADLVYIDETIVESALVDSRLTMQDLVNAVKQAVA